MTGSFVEMEIFVHLFLRLSRRRVQLRNMPGLLYVDVFIERVTLLFIGMRMVFIEITQWYNSPKSMTYTTVQY